MENNVNQDKALLIPALFLTLSIVACGSNTVVISTPTNPDYSGSFQPPSTMEILSTSTSFLGASPSNPVPVGSDVNADNMIFVIKGIVRPADGIVSSGDMFNAQPGQWQQYIFVTLGVTCEMSTDKLCHLSPFKFKLIGSDGILKYPERLISGVDGIFEDTDFYRGETISGIVPFIISIGDSHLLLIYESLSGDNFYLALP
jgi:hypothetical protein